MIQFTEDELRKAARVKNVKIHADNTTEGFIMGAKWVLDELRRGFCKVCGSEIQLISQQGTPYCSANCEKRDKDEN